MKIAYTKEKYAVEIIIDASYLDHFNHKWPAIDKAIRNDIAPYTAQNTGVYSTHEWLTETQCVQKYIFLTTHDDRMINVLINDLLEHIA